MLAEPIYVPTGTLIDMLFAILADEAALTTRDVANLAQIQRELHWRGRKQDLDFRMVN